MSNLVVSPEVDAFMQASDQPGMRTALGLGTAATEAATAFATAAQGATADTAVQPGDLGGAAYLNVGTTAGTVAAGNDSRLSNARTPTAHAASHKNGGTDPIKLDEFAPADDNTNLDASASAHGLMPKADKVKLNAIEDGADKTQTAVNASAAKTTLADNDKIPLTDSGDSNSLKHILWSAFRTVLEGIFAKKDAITASGLTMATGKMLGRSTASTGAVEEISIGSGLTLSAGTLSASGGGGGGAGYKVLGSAFSTSSTTAVEVTGLSLTLESGKTYRFEFRGRAVSNTITEAPRFGLDGPSKSNLLVKYYIITGTASATNAGEDDYVNIFTPNPGSGNTTDGLFWEVSGYITTTAAGTLKLLLGTETGGANSNEIPVGAIATLEELPSL